jgi:hypothetical protein
LPSIGINLSSSSPSSSSSSSSSSSTTLSDKLIVLRINWWSNYPHEPNSGSLTEASTKASNIFYPERFLDPSTDEFGVCGIKLSTNKMTISSSDSSKRHIFISPVNEYMAIYLPESFPESSQIFDVYFGPRVIYGALGNLNLNNNLQVNILEGYFADIISN